MENSGHLLSALPPQTMFSEWRSGSHSQVLQWSSRDLTLLAPFAIKCEDNQQDRHVEHELPRALGQSHSFTRVVRAHKETQLSILVSGWRWQWDLKESSPRIRALCESDHIIGRTEATRSSLPGSLGTQQWSVVSETTE